MDATAGKDMRKKSESNRNRRNPELPLSASYKRGHKRLPNGVIEQNATTSRSQRPTALYDLPMEMLDIILQKSYLHWILNSPIEKRDEDVIRSLISVDVCFNRRITRKRFKATTWRYLKNFYGKTRKGFAIIRNNRNYLLENVQPNDELIASLLSLNCITQEQSHFIQRQRSNQDKNDKLLYVAKSFDEAQFSNFVKCLRQTNQKTVTRIIENGGGTTKIELQSRGARCTASMESQQLLHKKIEDLRSKTKPRSHQTDKIISQLKVDGLEILNSLLDRQTVVIWIWCLSQASLEYIKKLYESNQLKDVFFEVIQTPISTVINIDENQFNKTTVVCAFSISFVKSLIKMAKNTFPMRVTKLRNEIYIFLKAIDRPPPPVFIHVFEGQNPFNWQKKIELTEIELPYDIVSNERENCLYVNERYEKCVWKITREEDGRHKIIKWLTTDHRPRSLSVSTDGRLMTFNDIKFSSSLMIYGSDAELIRSIQLPTDIKHPVHAVETSIGNFVILHEWRQGKGESESYCWGISELSRDGQMVIRRFIPSDETRQLSLSEYISIDSDDRVFVAGYGSGKVILLDFGLRYNRIIIPAEENEEMDIFMPGRLCYDEETKKLIVGGNQVNVYSLSLK